MFAINLTNNFALPLTYSGGNSIPPGSTYPTGNIGGIQTFQVPGIDSICVIDIGQQGISGYNIKGTWGVVIRYQTVEIYARYEGTGGFNFTIDQFGDLSVQVANGNAILIQLPGLRLVQTAVA